MQVWKFFLLGITGHLSKTKILPALAQFAALNQEKVQIELIGYSRSLPDHNEILSILNENSPNHQHCLTEIKFIQGEYTDATTFDSLIASLQDSERLVVYLAVPPVVFIPFLESCCPYSSKNIDVIVEKPFGSTRQEADKILEVVNACHLGKNIHFCDHYMFKTATMLSKADANNFKSIRGTAIKTIHVQLLEDAGVRDRGGYYDSAGALQDMLPHIISLTNLALNLERTTTIDNFESFETTELVLGQYASYLEDLKLEESKTDTYFYVEATLNLNQNPTQVILESGKKLGQKTSQIFIEFEDKSILTWKMSPEQIIELTSPEQSFSLNLDRDNKLDHTNMFESILDSNFDRFIKTGYILLIWWVYDKIIQKRTENNIQPGLYNDNIYPPLFLNLETQTLGR